MTPSPTPLRTRRDWLYVASNPHQSIASIQAEVAASTGISVERQRGAQTQRPVVDARHIAMWIAHHTGRSSPEIARAFGDRDHTTVLHAIKRVEASPALFTKARILAGVA